MAEDKRTTPGADRARRRRAAPTIDLEATEVEAPEAEAANPHAASAAQAEPAPDLKPEPKPQAERSAAPPSRSRVWGYVTAAMIGSVAAGIGAFVLWLNMPAPAPTDTGATARIAALETQLRELRAQPAPQPQQPSVRDAVPNERLAAIDNSLNALGMALAAFNKRSEEMSAQVGALRDRIDTDAKAATRNNEQETALKERIAALESAAKAAQQEAARNAGSDSAARIALAAIGLRDAALRGEPYAMRLAALKAAGVGTSQLAPLEPFANTGIPTEAKLAKDLTALVPRMAEAAGAKADSGFFERLQANAGKLVRVRPVNAPAGDDEGAVLARIEIEAARNNANGAQAEIARLPEAARAIAEPWSRVVAARRAAIAAAQKLADDTALALGKP